MKKKMNKKGMETPLRLIIIAGVLLVAAGAIMFLFRGGIINFQNTFILNCEEQGGNCIPKGDKCDYPDTGRYVCYSGEDEIDKTKKCCISPIG